MKKKVLIGIGIALGVLLFMLFLGLVWFMTGEPMIRVNYVEKLNELVRPGGIDDEQNGWSHYARAFDQYVEPDKFGGVYVYMLARQDDKYFDSAPLSEADIAKINQWVEQNRDEFEGLSEDEKAKVHNLFVERIMIFPAKTSFKYKFAQMNPETWAEYFPGYEFWPETEEDLWIRFGEDISRLIIQGAFEEKWHAGVAAELMSHWIKQQEEVTEHIPLWIRQNESAWQAFAAGSRSEHCWMENNEKIPMWGLSTPKEDFRDLSELGFWRAAMAERDGRMEEAFEECLVVMRADRYLRRPFHSWFMQLRGLAINQRAAKRMMHLIGTHKATGDELSHLQKELEGFYGEVYPQVSVEFERILFMDIVQHLFTEGGPGGGHLSVGANVVDEYSRYSREKISLLDSLFHERRDETVAKFNEICDHYDKLKGMTPFERLSSEEKSMDEIKKSLDTNKYSLVRKYEQAYDRIIDLNYECRAGYEAMVAVVAFKRWEVEKGEYPERLEELREGGYLQRLPDDPYGPGVLMYERRGEDFILYSWGADFDDDGGLHNVTWEMEDSDYVFWPIRN